MASTSSNSFARVNKYRAVISARDVLLYSDRARKTLMMMMSREPVVHWVYDWRVGEGKSDNGAERFAYAMQRFDTSLEVVDITRGGGGISRKQEFVETNNSIFLYFPDHDVDDDTDMQQEEEDIQDICDSLRLKRRHGEFGAAAAGGAAIVFSNVPPPRAMFAASGLMLKSWCFAGDELVPFFR